MSPDVIDEALRSLDPASPPADPGSPRARAVLANVSAAATRQPQPHRSHRWAFVAVAVAAAVTGVVTVPAITGGNAAYASWRSNPQPVGDIVAAQMTSGCLERLRQTTGSSHLEFSQARPVIAEQRGTWGLAILVGPNGEEVTCLGHGPNWLKDTRPMTSNDAGDFKNVLTTGGLTPHNMGTVNGPDGDISVLTGTADPSVAGVVYTSPSRGPVEATITAGRFALWVPGDDMKDLEPTGTRPDSGVTVQVTYLDGDTATEHVRF